MVWTVPSMWKGGQCWIIGGGPSLVREFEIPDHVVESVKNKSLPLKAYSPYLSFLHDKHIIGVNISAFLGDWVDILFFGDNRFYLENEERIRQFKGLKVTCHQRFSSSWTVKYLPKDNRNGLGISESPGKVRWNANSGAAAISLAVHTGVGRIYLLGFDMKLDNVGSQHWHSEYTPIDKNERRKERQLPFHRHLVGFSRIAEDAKRMGVEIVNVNPDSAIDVFPKVSMKELI